MFTLAVPVYDDYDSFSCSLVANLQLPLVKGAVVVDNNPTSKQGHMAAGLCRSLGVKYVPLKDNVGTASAKNRAVKEAEPGFVVCLDSHVILLPGSLEALAGFYERYTGARLDLVHGPLMLDNLKDFWTHFVTEWTPERAAGEQQRLKVAGYTPDKGADVVAGSQLWSEGMWGQWGTDQRGHLLEPFPIQSFGMGCFATHTDTWQGFNEDMRGFGGEEGYIHEKYRKSGANVWCVPGFRWWHRFGRGAGVPHRVLTQDKFRNYLLGFRELGLSTERLESHFKLWLDEKTFRSVVSGEYDPGRKESKSTCGTCAKPNPIGGMPTLDLATQLASGLRSDINEHVNTLRALAEQCDAVLDVGSRVESAVALAHAKKYHHLGSLTITDREIAYKLRGEAVTAPAYDSLPEYDLVFIDTDPHTMANVYEQLLKFGSRSRRYIVLHDTMSFGEKGSDGGPGIRAAVYRFVRERMNWTVIKHYHNNHGLMVLSSNDEDKKAPPNLTRKALTLAGSIIKHAVSLGRNASEEEQQERLDTCVGCTFRFNDVCGECGCPIEKKVAWKSEQCPVGKW